MTTSIPEFGIKATPNWQSTYFIGDAAVTIPPACGDGLAMGVLGGRLAAEYAVRNQALTFKTMWKKRCVNQMFWGKLLHKMMLNPTIGSPLFKLGNYLPSITRKVFELTRQ